MGGEGWRDVGEMGVSPPVHLGQNKGHGGDVLGKVIFYKGHHKPWARQHSKSNKSPVCAFRILRNDYLLTTLSICPECIFFFFELEVLEDTKNISKSKKKFALFVCLFASLFVCMLRQNSRINLF